MSQSGVTENQRRQLSPDAVISLWELDWSNLAGNPKGTDVRRFVADSDSELTAVLLGGVSFDPLPVRASGFEVTAEGAPRRPTIEIANMDGFMSAIIAAIPGGDMTGALVTRRRIFAKNLDGGSDPDPLSEWEPQRYRVERKTSETRIAIEFELSAKADVEVQLPLRKLDHNHCPWAYKGPDCGWDPENTAGEMTNEGRTKTVAFGTVNALPTTSSFSDLTLTEPWEVDEWVGDTVEIVEGPGSPQSRTVVSNTSNTITVDSPFSPALDTEDQHGGGDDASVYKVRRASVVFPAIYFDRLNAPSSQGDDDCSLTVQGCKLRFKAREKAVPFGGQPGIGRIVR